MLITTYYREGDPKGWSTLLVTALGSWKKTVPCGHLGFKNYAAKLSPS